MSNNSGDRRQLRPVSYNFKRAAPHPPSSAPPLLTAMFYARILHAKTPLGQISCQDPLRWGSSPLKHQILTESDP